MKSLPAMKRWLTNTREASKGSRIHYPDDLKAACVEWANNYTLGEKDAASELGIDVRTLRKWMTVPKDAEPTEVDIYSTRYWTCAMYAEQTNTKVDTVRTWCKGGKLPSLRQPDRSYRIDWRKAGIAAP